MGLILQGKFSNGWMNIIFILVMLTIVFIWYFQVCRMPIEVTGFAVFPKPANDELPVTNEGSFSVITYNVAGLPAIDMQCRYRAYYEYNRDRQMLK